mgnify:CR=1 FL=1
MLYGLVDRMFEWVALRCVAFLFDFQGFAAMTVWSHHVDPEPCEGCGETHDRSGGILILRDPRLWHTFVELANALDRNAPHGLGAVDSVTAQLNKRARREARRGPPNKYAQPEVIDEP